LKSYAYPAVDLNLLVPDLTMKDYKGNKILFEELEIIEKIADGGSATVYKGKYYNQLVAIKQVFTVQYNC
jgi:hypothetical protein